MRTQPITSFPTRIITAGLISLISLLAPQAAAVTVSSDFFAAGTPGSGIQAAGGTGTRPGNIYVSDGTNGNALSISALALGLQSFADTNLDAIHFGAPRQVGQEVLFSVDFSSNSGVPGSGIADASGTGTRPANIYSSHRNGTNATLFSGPDLGFKPMADSNLNAFDLGDPPTSTDFAPTTFPILNHPIYFSVDFGASGVQGSALAAAAGTGLKPSNIYVSYGDGNNSLFMSGADLGFVAFSDSNLDALFVGNDGYVYFSADRGASGVTDSGLDNASGTGLKAANIYRSSGNGTNELYISAADLGIVPFTDPDIDALTFVPEPSTFLIMALGLMGMGTHRWRHAGGLKK